MESSKVNQILMLYKDKVDESGMAMLMNSLKNVDDSVYDRLLMVQTKEPLTTCLLSIFLGGLGVDRFFIGDIGLGVAKLLLGWLTLGIWPLIDIFCSYKACKKKNFTAIMQAINIYK